MNDRGRLQKGDRVSRKCSDNHTVIMQTRTGTVTHATARRAQVQWDNGRRVTYDQDVLTYVPEEKKT